MLSELVRLLKARDAEYMSERGRVVGAPELHGSWVQLHRLRAVYRVLFLQAQQEQPDDDVIELDEVFETTHSSVALLMGIAG